MRRASLDYQPITINQFLKEFRESFPNFEYKATSKEGVVFKSSGYELSNSKITTRKIT